MPKIFISYRRLDEPAYAHLLKNKLDQYLFLNPDEIFLDVRKSGIQIGEYFDDVIREEIKETDVLILIIGSRWTSMMQERAQDEHDWVRLELSSAMKYRKLIIPVLVEQTKLPKADLLPKDIQDLCRINTTVLRVGSDFESDVDKIANAIHDRFPSPPVTSQVTAPKAQSWGPGCIPAHPPRGFQTEEAMNRFLTEHVGYPCSCMNPQDRQTCAKEWHTWRVKDQYGYSRRAVAFCGKDHLSQSGNFKLNLNLEGLDEMICEAKALGYRVVPCPDNPSGRVIITPSPEPSDEQLKHMARWTKLAQLLSSL